MENKKKELSPFIETMLKKMDEKEVAKPQTLVMDTPKDPELKPYLAEEDVEKVEKEVKRIQESVK